jgi:hypothetical protein
VTFLVRNMRQIHQASWIGDGLLIPRPRPFKFYILLTCYSCIRTQHPIMLMLFVSCWWGWFKRSHTCTSYSLLSCLPTQVSLWTSTRLTVSSSVATSSSLSLLQLEMSGPRKMSFSNPTPDQLVRIYCFNINELHLWALMSFQR